MNRRLRSDRALTRNPIARSLALAVLGVALVGAVIMGAVVFAVLLGLLIVGYLVMFLWQLLWAPGVIRVQEPQPAASEGDLIPAELVQAEYEVADASADSARREPRGSV